MTIIYALDLSYLQHPPLKTTSIKMNLRSRLICFEIKSGYIFISFSTSSPPWGHFQLPASLSRKVFACSLFSVQLHCTLWKCTSTCWKEQEWQSDRGETCANRSREPEMKSQSNLLQWPKGDIRRKYTWLYPDSIFLDTFCFLEGFIPVFKGEQA